MPFKKWSHAHYFLIISSYFWLCLVKSSILQVSGDFLKTLTLCNILQSSLNYSLLRMMPQLFFIMCYGRPLWLSHGVTSFSTYLKHKQGVEQQNLEQRQNKLQTCWYQSFRDLKMSNLYHISSPWYTHVIRDSKIHSLCYARNVWVWE